MKEGIKLVSNGTDNHLMLIDLRPSDFMGKGKEVQIALDEAGITANKNAIPYEPASPFNPSGIRLGTPAVTTRGMKESEMKVIGHCIAKIINDKLNPISVNKAKSDILELTGRFPLYPKLGILK
jgi:glycine hydroxymethyltransferase